MTAKKLIIIFFSFLVFFGSSGLILAAKNRPPRGWKDAINAVKTTVGFRTDRRALIISFGDFNQTTSAAYSLTYNADGIDQGVTGTVYPQSGSQTKEIIFGTCSGSTCTYHQNIKNAKLTIESTLNSGTIVRKRYLIKI